MDKEKFVKAIELNKEIEEFETHKKALESSNIQYGGGLIFTYNSMHNDVPLKKELFGKDFFKNYMAAWAEKGCWNWVLKDAILFDKPIEGAKGKLSFWIPKDEQQRIF